MTKTKKRSNLIPFTFVLGVGCAITAIASQQPDNNPVTFVLAGVTVLAALTTYGLTNRKKS
ncbi:hypothetical protein ACWFMI_00875 [Nocardiopsis terrae]